MIIVVDQFGNLVDQVDIKNPILIEYIDNKKWKGHSIIPFIWKSGPQTLHNCSAILVEWESGRKRYCVFDPDYVNLSTLTNVGMSRFNFSFFIKYFRDQKIESILDENVMFG
jgi:hypothetical protein